MLMVLWVVIILFAMAVWGGGPVREGPVAPPPTSLLPQTEQPAGPPDLYEPANGDTITMRVGERKKIFLSGNATTGYAWRIVRMVGSSVRPDAKWDYSLKSPFLTGSGGYFVREFEAVEPGLTEVYLIYDPVSNPVQLGYYYFLSFDVRG